MNRLEDSSVFGLVEFLVVGLGQVQLDGAKSESEGRPDGQPVVDR